MSSTGPAAPPAGGQPLRVAVIGSGPAGVYAADQLLRAALPRGVEVDVLERLPAPFGLVRYGVSPDHPRIKDVADALLEVLGRPGVRLLGNVEVVADGEPGSDGTGVPLGELRRFYDAVVVATGASADAALAIPGADLPGCFGASEVVAWYGGHPDAPRTWPLDAREVAVLGVGNVALDITRMLARPAEDLLPSDVPHEVYEQLLASALTDVHVFGRRGAAQVRFSPMELRELGEVAGIDVVVDPATLELDPASAAVVATDRGARQVVEALRALAGRPLTGAPRRVHLHLHQAPVAVLGAERVEGLRTERTVLDQAGNLSGTGELTDWPVQAVYRAVGYTGRPVFGLPFDAARGVVRHVAGRVVGDDGIPLPGLYVNGWAKRGATGLIGASRRDAKETVASLVADLGHLPPAQQPDPGAVVEHLAARGADVVDLTGWGRLDAHELGRGAPHGRARVKVVSREEMLAAARAAAEDAAAQDAGR